MKSGLLFFFTILVTCMAHAQEYPYRRYTMEDGMVHSTVYRIYQDRKGFLWFCTDYGISMFNGKTFKNYGEEQGLTHKCALSVSDDDKGNKYVCTYKGAITVINDSEVRPWTLKNGDVFRRGLYTLPYRDKIWVISYTNDGTRLFLVKNDSIRKISVRWHNEDVDVNKIDRFGDEILFTTAKGVYKVYNDTLVLPYLAKHLGGQKIDNIRKDDKGGYWAGVENSIKYIHNDSVKRSYTYKGGTNDILIDRNKTVWASTENGDVYLINDTGIRNIVPQLKISRRLVLTDLFEDSEGNIWMATQGLGVFRINSLDICNYPAEYNKINNYCNALAGVGSEVWTGSFGTISIWNHGNLNAVSTALKPSEFVYFIKNVNSRLYIGSANRLMVKETNPPYKETYISKDTGAISFCRDLNGDVLVSGFTNLYRLKNDRMVRFDSTGFWDNKRCNVLEYDLDGTLWVSTDSCVIACQNRRYSYPEVPGFGYVFKAGKILRDHMGRMWFSTANGLICKDKNGYRVFTVKDGLVANMCRELYEDGDGNLWVSTFNGINVVDLNTLKITEFVVNMSMPEIISLHKYGDNLLIGTIEGLSVVNIQANADKGFIPPLFITSVKTSAGNIDMPWKVVLPYDDKKLQVEIAGLSYRYPERVEYRYRIRNLDNKWQYTKNNTIELSALPPGNYNFIVNTRLAGGNWSRDVALGIVVKTPFWMTWWFRALAGILILLVIFFGLKKWITAAESKKRNQLHALNKIIYLKQQALSALINPHFIFNCMNSIQHYLHQKNHELANSYLADFASLIRMTMENAQEVFISLDKEIERLRLYLSLEKLRIGEGLTSRIIIDPDADLQRIRIPNMILQPYVENAIWHGIMPKKSAGEIIVEFRVTGEQLKIIVRDDGIGIKKTEQVKPSGHRSLGMKLTETRLALLNKLLDEYYNVTAYPIIENGETKGTIVEITMPVSPDERDIKMLEAELVN